MPGYYPPASVLHTAEWSFSSIIASGHAPALACPGILLHLGLQGQAWSGFACSPASLLSLTLEHSVPAPLASFPGTRQSLSCPQVLQVLFLCLEHMFVHVCAYTPSHTHILVLTPLSCGWCIQGGRSQRALEQATWGPLAFPFSSSVSLGKFLTSSSPVTLQHQNHHRNSIYLRVGRTKCVNSCKALRKPPFFPEVAISGLPFTRRLWLKFYLSQCRPVPHWRFLPVFSIS